MARSSFNRRLALAIDLGGTKVLGGLIAADRRVLWERRYPVDPRGGKAVIGQLTGLIHDIERLIPRGAGLEGVGVAVPGAVRADGTVWAPNLQGWTRVPLAERLSQATGLRVTVENDRITSLLGERWCGAARNIRDAAFVIVGTGLGVGVMVDGRPCRGARGVAGSIGWWTASAGRPASGAARIGSLEAAVAGPAIVRRMKRARISGSTPRDLVIAARRGDARAAAVIADVAERLGRAVADLVSLLDPELVILGGGIAQAGHLLLGPVRAAVRRQAQPLARSVPVVRSALGIRAGFIGAATLVYPDVLQSTSR
jgi:glucokinase